MLLVVAAGLALTGCEGASPGSLPAGNTARAMSQDGAVPPAQCSPAKVKALGHARAQKFEFPYGQYFSGCVHQQMPNVLPPAFDLDGSGGVHLLYQYRPRAWLMPLHGYNWNGKFSEKLIYATRASGGAWKEVTFKHVAASCRAIGAVSAKEVHLLWVNQKMSLQHATQKSGKWSIGTVNKGVICPISAAASKAGVAVSYVKLSNKTLHHARYEDDKWHSQVLATSAHDPSLVLMKDGRPAVAFTQGDEVHVMAHTASGWTRDLVSSAGSVPRLARDGVNGGRLHLAYGSAPGADPAVRVATRSNGVWSSETVMHGAALQAFAVDQAGKRAMVVHRTTPAVCQPPASMNWCMSDPQKTTSSCASRQGLMLGDAAGGWVASPLEIIRQTAKCQVVWPVPVGGKGVINEIYERLDDVHTLKIRGKQLHMTHRSSELWGEDLSDPHDYFCGQVRKLKWGYKVSCF